MDTLVDMVRNRMSNWKPLRSVESMGDRTVLKFGQCEVEEEKVVDYKLTEHEIHVLLNVRSNGR